MMDSRIETRRRLEVEKDTKSLVETLRSELSGSRATISALLKSADQVLAIGATILVSVALLSLRKSTNELTPFFPLAPIVAPFIFGLLAAYWIRVRTAVNALGGYKAALEECLVSTVGDHDIRLWESGGAEILKARFGYRLNMYLNALAFLTSVLLAAFKAAELGWATNHILVVAYWILLILLAASLALAVRDSTRAFEETRENSLRYLPIPLRCQTEDNLASGETA